MNNDNLCKTLEANRRFYAQKFPHIYGKGYNPDEPRDWHGRWTSGGGSSVTLHDSDGSTETRSGGSRSWRNNNPGNIISGSFANAHGAIGNNNGFAVFPDEATGQAASEALLRTSTYSPLTIDQAVARRSPPGSNDTPQVQRNVRSIGQFSGKEVVGDLDQGQLSRLVGAIQRAEGYWSGTITHTPPR